MLLTLAYLEPFGQNDIMAKPETDKLYPATLGELPDALQTLWAGKNAGCIVLREFFDTATVEALLPEEGLGFSNDHRVQTLGGIVVQELGSSLESRKITELGALIFGHPWHLAQEEAERPSMRLWVHLRDYVRFWVACSDGSLGHEYDISVGHVRRHATTEPSFVDPEPGDAILFVDRGLPSVTGYSTFHCVEIEPGSNTRRSIACDITIATE